MRRLSVCAVTAVAGLALVSCSSAQRQPDPGDFIGTTTTPAIPAEATGPSAGIAGVVVVPMKSPGSGWRCALLHETSASPATAVTAQTDNLRISPPNVLRARSLIRAGGQ